VGGGLEVEGGGGADPAHLDVGRGILPHRHARVGDVRHHEQEALDPGLDLVEPGLPRLDPVRDALHLRLEVGGVLLRLRPPCDLLPHRALAVTQALDLLDESAALGVEVPGVDALEPGPGLDLLEGLAPGREHPKNALPVLHDEPQIEHGRPRIARPRGVTGPSGAVW